MSEMISIITHHIRSYIVCYTRISVYFATYQASQLQLFSGKFTRNPLYAGSGVTLKIFNAGKPGIIICMREACHQIHATAWIT